MEIELLQNSTESELQELSNVVGGNWTPTQVRYMLFLINRPLRKKRKRGQQSVISELEYAQELGVDRSTLINWKHSDGFWDAVSRLYSTYFLENDMKVDDVLLHKALAGDVRAIKLYYERRKLLKSDDIDDSIIQVIIKRETVKREEDEESESDD